MCRPFAITKRSTVDHASWSFAVYGRVRRAVVLGYDDLLNLPSTIVNTVTYCAATPVHAEHPMAGEWQGVALSDLMAEADLTEDARSAVIYGTDGSQLALPILWMQRAVLAYKFDGETLSPEQGYPARLIVPGTTACYMPRWVERIEWITDEVPGPAYAENLALFTSPQSGALLNESVQIQGLAVAVNYSLTLVELNIDDGPWMDIMIGARPNQIARWSLDWTPPGAGQYSLRVRTSHTRGMQTPHQITVMVR